jgi:cytochrome c peroxidase
MSPTRTLLLLLAFGVNVTAAAQTRPMTEQPGPRVAARNLTPLTEPVGSPLDNPTTPEKVALGRLLFFDPRLSGDNSTSCTTCHMPDKAFTDGLPCARGVRGKELSRNTPSLLNVAQRISPLVCLEYTTLVIIFRGEPIQIATRGHQDRTNEHDQRQRRPRRTQQSNGDRLIVKRLSKQVLVRLQNR